MDPKSLFSLSDHLEVLQQTVAFDYFWVWLDDGLVYSDGAKGGLPQFEPVMMFKA